MKGLRCVLVLAVLFCVYQVVASDSSLDAHWENFKQVYKKQYSGQEEGIRRPIWEGHVADIFRHNLKYNLGQHSFRKGLNEYADMQVYEKQYSCQEEGVRRLIWEAHVADIFLHNLKYNLGLHSFKKGLNEYADMSPSEFVKTMNGFRRSKLNSSSATFLHTSNMALPDSVDWRKQGLVTPIKNQGKCGSCWAFSTTGSLEGQHKKKTGKLVSLSEQNLVDCSGPEGNSGCEGGLMDRGFQYIKMNGGIDTEQAYPYTAKDGTCHYKASASGATVTGYVDIPSGDESALQKAVATIGPISVAIDASQFSFQLYSGGIYDEPSCSTTELDHAVLTIGYGTADGKDYWLVKNSWGTSWGENGYIKMTRNRNNQCGIATKASYPLV